jgi:uncharacterized protein (DUF697 family)
VAKLPVNLSKAMNAWKEVTSNADQSVSIVLAGDPHLVGIAQEKFSVGGTVPATWVGALSELSGLSGASGEILLVLVDAEREAEVLAALEQAAPKGGAVVAVQGGSGAGGRFGHPWKNCIRVAFSDDASCWRQVYAACAQLAGDRVVGLGRRYPVLRSAAAQRIIYRSAGQNALIGLVFILPGADMPAMTLNQLKMVLYLAGMYGDEIGVDRAIEIAGIIAIGFGFRGLARKIASLIPGFGWLYKGIVGYTATIAVGMAAMKYFELGAPASTSKAIALASSLRR